MYIVLQKKNHEKTEIQKQTVYLIQSTEGSIYVMY